MGEIVNLRLARKAKARSENEVAAAANRARFGVAKSEKTLTAARLKKDAKNLDGHELNPDQPEKP